MVSAAGGRTAPASPRRRRRARVAFGVDLLGAAGVDDRRRHPGRSRSQRSSRAIECHCRQDVAYRVITGNLIPDHATIARFVCRHERALGELFGEVLGLCDRAGLVNPGVVSIDGTRIAGNASPEVNYEFEQIAERSWPRPGRPTRPRTSSPATRAVMSCPNSCARRRADASSFARRGDNSGAMTSTPSRARSPRPSQDIPEQVPLEVRRGADRGTHTGTRGLVARGPPPA